MTFDPNQPLSAFVSDRVNDLIVERRATWETIARAAGYKSANVLKMVADGSAKLPLDRVNACAKALEVDASDLMVLAVHQYFDDELLERVASARVRERQVHLERATASAISILAVAGATREKISAVQTDPDADTAALEEAIGHFDRLIAEVKSMLADIKGMRRG